VTPRPMGKKIKPNSASPDDVRVVVDVVHPVEIKIEKGMDDSDEEKTGTEGIDDDANESDDEFGLSTIPTKPEDINRNIAAANNRGGEDASGKRSGLKYFMQVFNVGGVG
jgi:hypothetical protein